MLTPLALLKRLPPVPPAVFQPLLFVTAPVQRMIVERVLNQVLGPQLGDGELDFLEERHLRVHVKDVGFDWFITKQGPRLALIGRVRRPAVSITGNAREFLLLAAGSEDPDTLFFQRRLAVEGDTELGLLVKNLLDSIDRDALPRFLGKALRIGAIVVEP